MIRNRKFIILGAGFAGLCMAIKLKERGHDNFVVLEKKDRIGGTWRENTYPGVACDIPAHLYAFSFAPNPDWSRVYASGSEIQAYLEGLVERYGLASHFRFGWEVNEARFGEEQWHVTATDGQQESGDFLISGLGGLHVPRYPDIPGLEDFSGPTLHSAKWDKDVPLDGKKVCVIGSAASAVQLIPELARKAEHLTVFQRTPNWVLPRRDRSYSETTKTLFRKVPFTQTLYRLFLYAQFEARFPIFRGLPGGDAYGRWLGKRHLTQKVESATLREKLLPDYSPGCKRILLSDDFLPALQRPNVSLITEGLERVEESGVRTKDGQVHAADALVLATGFEPFSFLNPFEVFGRDGRRLSEQWQEGVRSHRTVTMPGFPNFFMLLGPNSALGHNSVVIMIEAQVKYIFQCLEYLEETKAQSLEPTQRAYEQFNAGLREDMKNTVWESGCQSWYQDANGHVFTLWPHSTLRYRHEMTRLRRDEYQVAGPETTGAG